MITVFIGMVSMISWGLSDFLVAKACRGIGNYLTAFIMQFLSLIYCLSYLLFTSSSVELKAVSNFLPFLVLASILTVIGYISFYRGLEKGRVAIVSPVVGSASGVVAFLSTILLGELLSSLQILAIILITFGILALSLGKVKGLSKINLAKGSVEGIITMFCWVASTFLVVPVIREVGWFQSLIINKMLMSFFLFLILTWKKPAMPPKNKISFHLLFLMALLNLLGFFAYYYGAVGNYISIMTAVADSYPVITIILALIFLKENISPKQLLGVATITMGIVLISF